MMGPTGRLLTLTEMNDLVYVHFLRITGGRDRFQFAPWWAERVREVVRLQCEDLPALAAARWGNLKRGEQQQRTLAYLASLPAESSPRARVPVA